MFKPEIEITERIFRGMTAIAVATKGMHGLTGQRKADGLKVKDLDGADLPDEFYYASKKKLESSDVLNKISTTLQHLKQVRNDAGAEFRSGTGVWLVPNHRVPEVLNKMRELRDKLYTLWEDFADNHFDEAVANAKKKLGEHFRERDYPTKQVLKEGFSVEIRVVPLVVPDTLKKLDEIAYKEQVEMANKEAASFSEFICHTLREELHEVLAKIVNATNPGIDGKKGAVRKTVLEKFNLLWQRIKELSVVTDEKGDLFCPNGCEINGQVAVLVEPDTSEEELPQCPHCQAQVARKTVVNYAYRIRRAMEGIGVQVDNVSKGTAALKEMHVKVLLHKELSDLAMEAETTLDIKSSKRFIQRRKSKSGQETNE